MTIPKLVINYEEENFVSSNNADDYDCKCYGTRKDC